MEHVLLVFFVTALALSEVTQPTSLEVAEVVLPVLYVQLVVGI